MNMMARVISLFLILSLLSCGSMPKTAQAPQANQQPAQTVEAAQAVQTAPVNWTGNGGRGTSLAILAPKASGLTESQGYLPALVQGEFVSNFSGFSAIEVLDRERLDDQYAELFSGYYDDNAQTGFDLGRLTPTTHIMGGSITRTETGYALQMQITKTADKMTTASYSGTFTFADLDNLTGIRRASLDLLQKMGVTLTAQARGVLAGPASANSVNAQTALAQGITAQRQGTEVAASSYYYNLAAALDPSLLEAASRSSIMSANISSGNIGADTRNDINWRRDWIARLEETEQFFDSLFNANSLPYTLLYSTEIKADTIDYQNETRTLNINTNLHATGGIWLTSVERALQAVYDGIEATGRKRDWGLQDWPWRSVTNIRPFERRSKRFSITAELVNSNGKVIGTTSFQSEGSWGFNSYSRPEIQVSSDDRKQASFANVKADDITDRLTIQIASVNGTDAPTAARNGVLQIKAISREEWNNYLAFSMNKGVLTGYNGSGGNVVIPSTIWDEPVTSIGARAFQNKNLTGISIPNSVTTIGDSAFANNNVTRWKLSNNITYIGDRAFYDVFSDEHIFNITIPNSVTTIGDSAFRSNYIKTINIGANVNIANNAIAYTYTYDGKTYTYTFAEDYNKHGQQAGYYETTGGSWRFYTQEEWQARAQKIERNAEFKKSPGGRVLSLLGIGAAIAGIVAIIKFFPDTLSSK
jgi:hypothetical protein